MDEEEYQEEEQSNSKINLGSFFERVDSVEKVASNALSKANANFGIISAQKTLINTLNLSIEALETKVRDIANYIIIEKKITRDEEADRLVEERDKEQKNITAERLMGLKGDQGVQGEPGEPAPAPEEGGGNPLMSFLKGIAALGIAGFAVTYLWPALLPLIGPLLGKVGLGLMVGSGALLGGFLGAQLLKVPFVGKKMGPAVEKGIEGNFTKVGEGIQKAAENIGKDGNFEIPNLGGGNGEGGGEGGEEKGGLTDFGDDYKAKEEYYQSKEYLDSAKANEDGIGTSYEDMKKTLEKKDLVKFEKKYKEGSYEFESSKKGDTTTTTTRFKGKTRYDMEEKKAYIFGEEVTLEGYKEYVNLPDEEKDYDAAVKFIEQYGVNKVEPIKEDNMIDSFSFAEDIGMDDSQFLGELINVDPTGNLNNSQNKGQVVNTPYNLPNTTETTVKFTDMKVPFLKSLSNQYLSISGKTIPPEYYRAFK